MRNRLIDEVRARYSPEGLYVLWPAASRPAAAESFAAEVALRWEEGAEAMLEALRRLASRPEVERVSADGRERADAGRAAPEEAEEEERRRPSRPIPADGLRAERQDGAAPEESARPRAPEAGSLPGEVPGRLRRGAPPAAEPAGESALREPAGSRGFPRPRPSAGPSAAAEAAEGRAPGSMAVPPVARARRAGGEDLDRTEELRLGAATEESGRAAAADRPSPIEAEVGGSRIAPAGRGLDAPRRSGSGREALPGGRAGTDERPPERLAGSSRRLGEALDDLEALDLEEERLAALEALLLERRRREEAIEEWERTGF